jgi:hypothetical protein
MANPRIIHAIFEGGVLRPEDATGLEPNRRYRITIEEQAEPEPSAAVEERYRALIDIASDMGFTDFTEKHLKK